jgi:complement component 1 Q subcomponent-binding protein
MQGVLVRLSSRVVRGFQLAGVRAFASRPAPALSTTQKLVKVLNSELAQEQDQYEQPSYVQQFLKENPEWSLQDEAGDVNMKLSRETGGKLVTVEWQLVSPFNPSYPEEGAEGQETEAEPPMESTDFTITVADKATSERGLIFYCSTAAGEGEHEYVIGNVRSFDSAAERDSVTGYNGPDFEDLNEEVQQTLDEYLATLGINDQVRLFVDTAAIDKEQREYNRWLKNTVEFLKH